MGQTPFRAVGAFGCVLTLCPKSPCEAIPRALLLALPVLCPPLRTVGKGSVGTAHRHTHLCPPQFPSSLLPPVRPIPVNPIPLWSSILEAAMIQQQAALDVARQAWNAMRKCVGSEGGFCVDTTPNQ